MRVFRLVLIALIVVVSTFFHVIPMLLLALVKAVLPWPRLRVACNPLLSGLAESWVGVNNWMWDRLTDTRLQLSGDSAFCVDGHYLVLANHQSWVDILVLQKVFNRRIPMLKFFLKKELIYVPVIGLAWWALDFPFMQRKGGASARQDLEAARKACEKFRLMPTSVMSFVEGTRFTPAKHAQQKSPYQHLLKPKVGGIGMALETLGDAFTALLDVTIVYPQATRTAPTLVDLMCGRVRAITVQVHVRQIGPEVLPAQGEPAPRAPVQAWINGLWQDKDAEITQVLQGSVGASRPKARRKS